MVVYAATASDVYGVKFARSKCWLTVSCRLHALFSRAYRGYHSDGKSSVVRVVVG